MQVSFKLPTVGLQVARIPVVITFIRQFLSSISRGRRYRTRRNRAMLESSLPTPEIESMGDELNKNNTSTNTVKEGKADVYLPQNVFYNPVQEFNRDLTIAVITNFSENFLEEKRLGKIKMPKKYKKLGKTDKTCNEPDEHKIKVDEPTTDLPTTPLVRGEYFKHGITILEALAASGIRSMRFGLEIPGVKNIVANDFSQDAVDMIKKNIKCNSLEKLVTPSFGDACKVMYENKDNGFDVIDLDPYGSPSIFLDSAIQAVSEGGLMCVTATDMANLCGNAPEACHSKYGSMAIRTDYCHEMAMRIVLQSINSHANRHCRYIVPLLSISADFYIRMFVRVYTGAQAMKDSVTKLALVHRCCGCGDFHLERLAEKVPTKNEHFKVVPKKGSNVPNQCVHCSHAFVTTGPVWADPIHNKVFVSKVINYITENQGLFNTYDRILGMLTMCEEENDHPLYYTEDGLAKLIHGHMFKSIDLRSAILNAGYDVSASHAKMLSLKTNAPMQFLLDMLRTHTKNKHISEKRMVPGSVCEAIMSKDTVHQVNFATHPDAIPKSRVKGLVRYQVNPEKDWGPKALPKPFESKETMVEKRVKLQGKRKKKDDDSKSADDEGCLKKVKDESRFNFF